MSLFRPNLKRIGIDIAGFCLILLGLSLGWLPGPGGIPLVIAGLGLLSVNNHWARRLLGYFKAHSDNFMHFIFPNTKIIQAAHDVLVILMLAGAVYLLAWHRSAIWLGLSSSLIALAIIDFLFNRNRLKTWKHKH